MILGGGKAKTRAAQKIKIGSARYMCKANTEVNPQNIITKITFIIIRVFIPPLIVVSRSANSKKLHIKPWWIF